MAAGGVDIAQIFPIALITDGAETLWANAVASAPGAGPLHDLALRPRADHESMGAVIVAPLSVGPTRGALYADKLTRQGQFVGQDRALAGLIAEFVGLALGRLRALDHERLAAQKLAAVMDTIRDGVLAWDSTATLTQINAAAARLLRVAPNDAVGRPLADLPQLAPLLPFASGRKVDGHLLRLAHGNVVITIRPIETPLDTDLGGAVVTLMDLGQAQQIAQRVSAVRTRYSFDDIVGDSALLDAAVALARRAAMLDASILIGGESGTGKEVLAQAIHAAGPRAAEPFVGINCAALPRDLLEAELFGYERGAFTGARAQGNVGKFELAGHGTILLDEIGDMPLDMQAKMLRVLQERVVTRLGGATEVQMHARVIATTHRDLQTLVDEGKFRMDLLYRLRVLHLELPALRQRPEDIAKLALHFLRRFAEQQRKRLQTI
ncbi:MAG: sigma 54-interacting transcriptional regulator, partial [Myxococcales bacterium]